MATLKRFYAADGTLDDLQTTCQGDEDAHRARLTRLERAQKPDGTKATVATYEVIPFEKDFPAKDLFFFDITNSSPQQQRDISEQQMQAGHALIDDKFDVFINNKPSSVLVFRAQ